MVADQMPRNITRSLQSDLQHHFNQMTSGDVHHLGWRLRDQQDKNLRSSWQLTEKTRRMNKILQVILAFAEHSLHLNDCIAVRISKGAAVLTELNGYDVVWTIAWAPNCNEPFFTYEHSGADKINVREFMPDKWQQLRILQFCISLSGGELRKALEGDEPQTRGNTEVPDGRRLAEAGTPSAHNQPVGNTGDGGQLAEAPGGRHPQVNALETIPEGAPSEEQSEESEYFTHEDPEMLRYLKEAFTECLADAEEREQPSPGQSAQTFDAEGVFYEQNADTSWAFQEVVHNYHIIAANQRAGLPVRHGCDEEPDHIELQFYGHTHKLLYGAKLEPRQGEVVTVKMYLTGARKAVVQRDDDILTAEELRTHAKEVAAAMLKELQTWAKLQCFSRKKRTQAKNIIDCRWVIKWKHEVATSSASAGSSAEGAPTTKKVIRARLTVRGFKDMQAHNLDSYAGTSQRYSQRLVCSEAVLKGWSICTTDISKAFLQGVTYEELSELTGEPIREVNFTLPQQCVGILRQVPGFEDFDEHVEVLHCDKPGTGLVDAPRAFSMKLSMVTKDKCHMMPTSVDNELVVKFDQGHLVCIMAKHVDDLKLTGKTDVIVWVLTQIEKVFGELKIIWHEFTNCGLRHIQDKTTLEISLDQEEYIKNLKPIQHAELSGPSSERECSAPLHQLFMSLLGAVAYALMTRVDVAVFVCALQRVTHKPLIIHVKRLNAVLRWMQANPKKIWFRRMSGKTHLRCVGDAAFRKEENEGRSLRGAFFLRAVDGRQLAEATASFTTSSTVHIIDAVCKSQRRVTRSTFSSELLSACDAIDHGMLLALTMHELSVGVQSCAQSKLLREAGGWNVRLSLYVDAMSVYAAVTATFLKIPAEKSLLSHVQYLRELLDTKVLEALIWIDTRDMCADGLTKGCIDRTLIHSIMNGIWTLHHEAKCWSANKKANPKHHVPGNTSSH